jgi:hypothetical protein
MLKIAEECDLDPLREAQHAWRDWQAHLASRDDVLAVGDNYQPMKQLHAGDALGHFIADAAQREPWPHLAAMVATAERKKRREGLEWFWAFGSAILICATAFAAVSGVAYLWG